MFVVNCIGSCVWNETCCNVALFWIVIFSLGENFSLSNFQWKTVQKIFVLLKFSERSLPVFRLRSRRRDQKFPRWILEKNCSLLISYCSFISPLFWCRQKNHRRRKERKFHFHFQVNWSNMKLRKLWVSFFPSRTMCTWNMKEVEYKTKCSKSEDEEHWRMWMNLQSFTNFNIPFITILTFVCLHLSRLNLPCV